MRNEAIYGITLCYGKKLSLTYSCVFLLASCIEDIDLAFLTVEHNLFPICYWANTLLLEH
jgi:hypothetical protein